MRFVVASVTVALASTIWLACVGSDPASTSQGGNGVETGDKYGPCFSDGKCKEGLECREGRICIPPGEPTPPPDGGASSSSGSGSSSGSSGTNDASSDGSVVDGGGSDATLVDSGITNCGLSPSSTGGASCGPAGVCTNGQVCCAMPQQKLCADTVAQCGNSSGSSFRCDGPEDCNGNACCLVEFGGSTPVPTACTTATKAMSSSCSADTLCAGTGVTLCRSQSDCAGVGNCVLHEVYLGSNPTPLVWGVCK